MIKLTTDEYIAIAEELEVPLVVIEKMDAMAMLHVPMVLNVLIKHEYKKLRKMDKYKPGQIYRALANKYNVTLDKAIKGAKFSAAKNNYCGECNKLISRREWLYYDGKCEDCFIKAMNI